MTNIEIRAGSNGTHQMRNTYVAHSRLFLIVLLISLFGIYAWLAIGLFPTISWTPDLVAVVVTGLAIHFTLHGLSQYIGRHRVWALAYLLIQCGLLFILSRALRYPGVLLFEYGPLLGETVSLFESPWLAVLMTIQVYSLYTVSLGLSLATLPNQNLIWSIMVSNIALSLVGGLPYLVALTLQVRSRREAVELVQQLNSAHQRLSAYAEQVEDLTLAAERERMARELHDTLAQGVAGMILQLEALDASLEQGNVTRAVQVTRQIKLHAREVLSSSRQAIDELRILPEQLGALIDVLAQEVKRFSALSGIPTTFDAPSSLTLPVALAEHVLRCVAEGLANVAHHAHASHVNVTLCLRDNQMVIEVQDDGAGFDPETMEKKSGHYGLLGLRERAHLMGGILEMESTRGTGTTLRLRLPMLAQEGGLS